MKLLLKHLFTTPENKLWTKNYLIALGIGTLILIGIGQTSLPFWVGVGVALPFFWIFIATGNLLDWQEYDKKRHGA